MDNRSDSIPRRLAIGLAVAGAAGLAAPTVIRAAAAANLVRVGLFSKNLPTIVADAKGFWAAEGLQVQLLQVAGSLPQAQSLASGQYDLAFCSADNTANYRLNASTPLGQQVDFQIIAGQDLGAGLGLFARPGIASIEALAGARISVDAPDSGFAFVLYAILGSHGLEQGKQYDVTTLGGTAQRFAALSQNQTDATLLSAGFDGRAAAAGFPELSSVNQLIRPYLGSVIECSERWMTTNRATVVRFLRGYYKALQWSLAPSNQDEATALPLAATPGTDAKLATALYAAQVERKDGLIEDMTVNVPGLLTCSRCGGRSAASTNPGQCRTSPSSHPGARAFGRTAISIGPSTLLMPLMLLPTDLECGLMLPASPQRKFRRTIPPQCHGGERQHGPFIRQ